MSISDQVLTRRHLRGFGLSAYQAIALSKTCSIQGKSGAENLYAIADILLSARAYAQKSRIQTTTRTALTTLIQQLEKLTNNLVALPFGSDRSPATDAIQSLMKSNSETNSFKLRTAALRSLSHHV